MCSVVGEEGFALAIEEGDVQRQSEVLGSLIEVQSEESVMLLPWWVQELAAGHRLVRTVVMSHL
eukprot:SAG11_NODE_8636_length_993_cov_1.131991_2_plen_64_part_00